MIKYIVLTDNPVQEIETEIRDEAAKVCLKLGLPHFYEVDSENRIYPRGIWKISQNNESYDLKYQSWRDVVASHKN